MKDEEALKRSVNYPKRGIGDTTVEKVFDLSAERNVAVWEIIVKAGSYPGHFNAGTCKKA